MINFSKQRGLGFISLVLILVVASVFGLVGLRLLPMYTEYSGILRTVNQMAQVPDVKTMSKDTLKSQLLNKLYLNDVRSIGEPNFKQHFEFKDTAAGKVILINYSREAPLFSNIFITTKFEHEVKL